MNNKLQLLLLTIATISSAQIFGANQAWRLTAKQREIASWDRKTAVETFMEDYYRTDNQLIRRLNKAEILYGDDARECDKHRYKLDCGFYLQDNVEIAFRRLWAIVDAEKAQREQTEALMKLAAAREDQSTSILIQLREIQAQQTAQFAEISAKVETLGTRLSTVESNLVTTQAVVVALALRTITPAAAPATQPTSSWAMEQPD